MRSISGRGGHGITKRGGGSSTFPKRKISTSNYTPILECYVPLTILKGVFRKYFLQASGHQVTIWAVI